MLLLIQSRGASGIMSQGDSAAFSGTGLVVFIILAIIVIYFMSKDTPPLTEEEQADRLSERRDIEYQEEEEHLTYLKHLETMYNKEGIERMCEQDLRNLYDYTDDPICKQEILLKDRANGNTIL